MTPEAPTAPAPRRPNTLLVAVLSVLLGIVLATAGIAVAQNPPGVSPEDFPPGMEGEHDEDYDDDFYCEDLSELPAEELAEIQAEEDALAAPLDEQGIAYERIEETEGLSWVVPAGTQELETAIDAWVRENRPDAPTLADLESCDPEVMAQVEAFIDSVSDEEFAAALDAIAAHLDEQGIAYERIDEGDGIAWIVPVGEAAFWEAADDFYTERYGDELWGDCDEDVDGSDGDVEGGDDADDADADADAEGSEVDDTDADDSDA